MPDPTAPPGPYVLVTPARNEAATIEETLRSVTAQTLAPAQWIVVSDCSTDATDAIVRRYADRHPWLTLLRLEPDHARSFASVVFAVRAGIAALTAPGYRYLGLLDADIRFAPTYVAELLARFEAAPRLGLAGGLVVDVIDGKRVRQRQYLKEVAGATQFFRRECFESLGGFIAIPEGGWDALTGVQARLHGFETQTFPELLVEHLKPRNAAQGHALRRMWQFGVRDYALGGHPIFELVKCGARVREHPFLLSALARFAGFCWSGLHRRPRMLPAALIRQVQHEQLGRLIPRRGRRTDAA